MKINTLAIEGIAGISNLDINFNENMNLICGPNGIGKTTILECIAHTFSASRTKILKRNSLSEFGKFNSTIEIEGSIHSKEVTINDFTPFQDSQINGLHQYASYLMSLKVNRTFIHQPLNSVNKDVDKAEHVIYEEAKSGVKILEVKNWFVNRHLYSAHEGSLTEEQLNNLELAKRCFAIIDEQFTFSRVQASNNEIMVNTPNGEIYYEYLSSGFKSLISILFGIIKDIEFRFKSPCMQAEIFDGIILIDELELHLHPTWQAKVTRILKKVFPKAQFIVTTHSPHMVQNALPQEIIALERIDGKPIQRELPSEEFGFQGWSIEEVLIDVMGMKDTRTDIYHETIKQFETHIEQEDYTQAQSAFQVLEKLLHPNNHLLKLFKFDLISLGNSN